MNDLVSLLLAALLLAVVVWACSLVSGVLATVVLVLGVALLILKAMGRVG